MSKKKDVKKEIQYEEKFDYDYNSDEELDDYQDETELLKSAILKSNISEITSLIENSQNGVLLANQALYLAAENNKVEVLQHVLSTYPVDVNFKNENSTSLIQACYHSYFNIVQLLVENKADVNSKDDLGNTPLITAVGENNQEIVTYLLKHKASVCLKDNKNRDAFFFAKDNPKTLGILTSYNQNQHTLFNQVLEQDIENKIDFETRLTKAIENRNYDFINLLIENSTKYNRESKNIINGSNKEGLTPLMIAVNNDDEDMINYLIKLGADINKSGENGSNPFITAVKNNNLKLVKHLIKLKANLNIPDKNGLNCLTTAVKNNHLELVKYLVSNLTINLTVCDENGCSPITVAAENGHHDMISLLVELKADLELSDNNGSTALTIATEKGNYDLIKKLVKEYKVNINQPSNFQVKKTTIMGSTAFQIAARNGDFKLMDELRSLGADINVQDQDGYTVLTEAAINYNKSIIEKLIDEYKFNINQTDGKGRTALSAVIENSNYDEQRSNFDFIKFLINERKADISLLNEKMRIELTAIAIKNNNQELISNLIKNFGVQINSLNKKNRTLLNLAVANGNEKLIEFMIKELGANSNQEDKNGRTPLLTAIQANVDIKAIRKLIELGANIYQPNKNGFTPVGIAIGKGRHSLVKDIINTIGIDVNHLKIDRQNSDNPSIKLIKDIQIKSQNLEKLYKQKWRQQDSKTLQKSFEEYMIKTPPLKSVVISSKILEMATKDSNLNMIKLLAEYGFLKHMQSEILTKAIDKTNSIVKGKTAKEIKAILNNEIQRRITHLQSEKEKPKEEKQEPLALQDFALKKDNKKTPSHKAVKIHKPKKSPKQSKAKAMEQEEKKSRSNS